MFYLSIRPIPIRIIGRPPPCIKWQANQAPRDGIVWNIAIVGSMVTHQPCRYKYVCPCVCDVLELILSLELPFVVFVPGSFVYYLIVA
jgi:hypothetical protein